MVVVASLLYLLILAGALYDTARLLAPADSRRPPRSRRRWRRAALEAAERRLVAQRLYGRIDAATYRASMHALADGRHAPRATVQMIVAHRTIRPHPVSRTETRHGRRSAAVPRLPRRRRHRRTLRRRLPDP